MAVPSSGELKLWDDLWNQELGGSKGNNSLHSASVYAGFSTPDALGDFYGWSDVETPSVVSLTATNVNHSSATLRGNVTDTGNEDVTSGFYFGTANSATSNPKLTLPGTRGTGIYCCNRTSQISGQTTYKSWAFACNSAGECIATTCCTFSTPAPPFSPSQHHWYCCSVFNVDQSGTNERHHDAAAYALNPYTSAYQLMWTVEAVNVNKNVGSSLYGSSNSGNKWCHTGTYTSYHQATAESRVRSSNIPGTSLQSWETIFGPNQPIPAGCRCYPGRSQIFAHNSPTQIEFAGRKSYPSSGRPGSDSFNGYFCFPSIP